MVATQIREIGRADRAVFPQTNVIRKRATLAELNAGATLLTNTDDAYVIRVNRVQFVSRGGAMGALTLVRVVTDEGTPKVVATAAQANLTEGNYISLGITGFAAGAYYGLDLPKGVDLVLDKTGLAGTTATHIDVEIEFQILQGPYDAVKREAEALAVI